jgi:hypothetical protein
MKAIAIGGAAIFAVLIGMTAPAYAGQEHGGEKQAQSRPQPTSHEQARPEQQHAQPAPRQAQSRPEQQHAQPAQRQAQGGSVPHNQQQPRTAGNSQQRTQQQTRAAQNNRPQQRTQQQSHAVQNNRPQQRTPEQHRAQQSVWQQHRAGNWQTDHRTWQQRGGYNGYRIPDDRFRGYFGAGHGFRIGGLPFLVVGGYPRFQYGGYWLSVVDPWPAYWGDSWYDNDDVYVNYENNGYYLYNRRYPGVGLAVSVSF